jgi:hypothetical protein
MHLTFLQASLQTATDWKSSATVAVSKTWNFCSSNRVTLFTELSIWRIIIPDIRENFRFCHLIQTRPGGFIHSPMQRLSGLWRPELDACHSSQFSIDVYSAYNFNLNLHTCSYDMVQKDKLTLNLHTCSYDMVQKDKLTLKSPVRKWNWNLHFRFVGPYW